MTSSLLTKVRELDSDSWCRLTDMYGPLVYAWCRKAGVAPESAADLGQNVWMSVLRSIAQFDHQNFRGWLRVITHNEIRSYWKRQNRQGPEMPLNDWEASFANPPADELANETKLLFRRVIELIRSEFSERDWQAFWQVVVEDQDPADVAMRLGMTRNQVYLAKSRILCRVREETTRI